MPMAWTSKVFSTCNVWECLIWIILLSLVERGHFQPHAVIDLAAKRRTIDLTWKSTGLCPPLPHEEVCMWIRSASFEQNLNWISAIPNNGIEFVRVHWLLNAIFVERESHLDVSYNFSCLDHFIGRLHRLRMTPIFEVMGNPSNLFTDFENKTQISLWSDLMFSIATRYINTFGISYVDRWMFETWNEPKPAHFEPLKMTASGFLNYYDATATGLKRAHPLLKIVIPGGGCSRRYSQQNFCWLLLSHIHYGLSTFGNSSTTFPDFISIHKKGIYPNSSILILDGEDAFIKEMDKYFPLFQNITVVNDEADPEVSWNISRLWQADMSYAALMVKVKSRAESFKRSHVWNHLLFLFLFMQVIRDHLFSKPSNQRRVKLLSNDNAFLSFHPFPFTQRTLLARFQVNITNPPHVQFIRKPSYSVLGLLSLLGEDLVVGETSRPTEEAFSWIAAVHETQNKSQCWYLSVMLAMFNDNASTKAECAVKIEHFPLETHPDIMYVVHYMDNTISNPFKIWKESGQPQTPSLNLFARMRNHEEPWVVDGPSTWTQGCSGQIKVKMASTSVSLLQFCSRTCQGPGQVFDVQVINITFNQVFIFWSDSEVNSRCILTYEVERSFDGLNFKRINHQQTAFNSFVYMAGVNLYGRELQEETVGYYRVRATDFWKTSGVYSLPVKYPMN